MHAIYGHTCHLCGHEGAHDADHLVPISVDPEQPIDPHTMRPAHGVRGCPVCGRKCNQERGNRNLSMFKPRLVW
jgi:5-methylcytosine-specific restriction endonuclease McrA